MIKPKTKFIIIFVLIIILALIYFLAFPKKKIEEKGVFTEKSKVTLSMAASQREIAQGDEFLVNVILDTSEFQADGVDVVLNYNPQYLEFKKIDYSDSVFSTFPPYSVIKGGGRISFSALSPAGQTFQGKGKVAAISFQALKQGESEIYFDFQPDSAFDSNVALHGKGKDILEKVDNLKILIE